VNAALPQLALERDGNYNLLCRYVYGMRRISQTSGNNTSFPRRSLFARSPVGGWDRNADEPRDDEKLAARR
jgi:hypothetical protein